VDELFEHPPQTRSIKVELPTVKTPLDHYAVRMWLLGSGWEEFTDWMIARESFTTGIYEVWFTDIRKAVYFKLCFSL
jgi:hypothetical protein